MPCWVVPTVAAELWECHIDRITNAIRDGNLKTKEEAGWMFVDIAPNSPVMETGTAKWAGSPWTMDVVSREEMDALSQPIVVQEDAPVQEEYMEVISDDPDQGMVMQETEEESSDMMIMQDDEPADEFEELPALHIADEDEPSEEETSDEMMADFRKVRQQVARTRIAPGLRTKAA